MKLHTGLFLFVSGMKARVGCSGTTARPKVFNTKIVLAVDKMCIVFGANYPLQKNLWFMFEYTNCNGG